MRSRPLATPMIVPAPSARATWMHAVPDAARGAVHEHGLALGQPPAAGQRQVRGLEVHDEARRRRRCSWRRAAASRGTRARRRPPPSRRTRSPAATRIPGSKPDSVGRAAHDAGDLEARDERQRRPDLVLAAADQVVDEPDARGVDLDQHDAVGGGRARRPRRSPGRTGRSRIPGGARARPHHILAGMELQEIVRAALAEDVGSGDATTLATVDAAARARATITQKAPGVVFGLDAAVETFAQLDGTASFERLGAGGRLARAPGRSVLRASRARRAALLDRRAHGAEPAAAPQRRRHADRALRPGRRGHRRADPRHAQDDAGPAGAREGRGARRRRHEPPHRPLRRDPDQGEPHRGRGRRRGGDRAGARRLPGPAARGRGAATPTRSTQALAAGAPRLLLDNMDPAAPAGARSSRSRAAPSSRRAAGSRSRRSGTTRSTAYTSSRSERSRIRPPP